MLDRPNAASAAMFEDRITVPDARNTVNSTLRCSTMVLNGTLPLECSEPGGRDSNRVPCGYNARPGWRPNTERTDTQVMYEELAEVAVSAAREGARVLRHYFRDNALEVRSKGRHDFVTRADHESEERIVAEALFVEGKQLMKEDKIDEACSKLEESYRLDPLPGVLLNLAVVDLR